MLTFYQSKKNHIDEIKETVKCLVKNYMRNQARTRLDRRCWLAGVDTMADAIYHSTSTSTRGGYQAVASKDGFDYENVKKSVCRQ